MDNTTPGMGHNMPPGPTPFEASESEIGDLYEEANNWLDGAAVETQGQADALAKLREMAKVAEKDADKHRAAEKKPHDDASKAIQVKWKPLIEKAVLIQDLCKKAVAPYLQRLEDEKRAAAERARREAEAKQAEALAAMRAAQANADLEQREQAEAKIAEAKEAEKAATRAGNEKAHAKGGARAMSLRTYYIAEIADEPAFARYVWENHRAELMGWMARLAQSLVDGKRRDIPGVTIREDKRAA